MDRYDIACWLESWHFNGEEISIQLRDTEDTIELYNDGSVAHPYMTEGLLVDDYTIDNDWVNLIVECGDCGRIEIKIAICDIKDIVFIE